MKKEKHFYIQWVKHFDLALPKKATIMFFCLLGQNP